MTSYIIREATGAGYLGDDDLGKAVIEYATDGEYIATIGEMTDLVRMTVEAVEAAAAQALGVDADDVTATPAGANISGDTSHRNLGVTADEWMIEA